MYTSAHALYTQMLPCWRLIQKWKSEVERRSYGTVAVVCRGSAWVGQVELRETLGDHAVQYCALQGGYRHATSNMQRMFCALVTITEQCVEDGRHCTVYILAECTGISGSAVL